MNNWFIDGDHMVSSFTDFDKAHYVARSLLDAGIPNTVESTVFNAGTRMVKVSVNLSHMHHAHAGQPENSIGALLERRLKGR